MASLWTVLHNLKPDFVSNIKTFYIFGKNGKEVIIVGKNNKVFAFGDNKYGCLGLGHNNVVKEPEIVNELCDQQIIDICSGKDCNVLSLTKSGKCFSWGRNNYGQLGNGSKTDENKPKLINELLKENVSQICCGNWHSLVLTTSKDLYGFGYNGYGEIGCGNNENQLIPVKIIGFINEKIKSMSCGNFFSLALTDVGHVFSWGYGDSGRLGNGSLANQYKTQRIYLNKNQIIKSICCGQYHSLLLTNDGDIYAFGYNYYGQCGNSEFGRTFISRPEKIDTRLKFKEIASHHLLDISVAKADDGYCYVWGDCVYGHYSKPTQTAIKVISDVLATFAKLKITVNPINLYFESNVRDVCIGKMLKIFNNPKSSDLKFKVENKIIHCHKVIIETNSKYFASKSLIFTRDMKETTLNKMKDDVIEITEYSYDVYCAYIKYLYTDCIVIEAENAMALLVLANDYEEEELKYKCVNIIKDNITIDNVCALYCTSVKYNLSEFENLCFDFAKDRLNFVFNTEGFRQMHENLMKKFIERAAKSKGFY